MAAPSITIGKPETASDIFDKMTWLMEELVLLQVGDYG